MYVYKKSLHKYVVLYKLLKNKFRANKLLKNLPRFYIHRNSSTVLQLQLTLFKELTLSLSKNITNVGSNLIVYVKNVRVKYGYAKVRLKLLTFPELLHSHTLYLLFFALLELQIVRHTSPKHLAYL